MTIQEIETELKRLKYDLSFDRLIINRTGQITNVLVQVKGDRIKFISNSMNQLIASYPAKVDSISKFLNTYWYANV